LGPARRAGRYSCGRRCGSPGPGGTWPPPAPRGCRTSAATRAWSETRRPCGLPRALRLRPGPLLGRHGTARLLARLRLGGRLGRPPAALAQAGRLADAVAQVVELRPPDLA